jgi:type III pantothenate kinase
LLFLAVVRNHKTKSYFCSGFINNRQLGLMLKLVVDIGNTAVKCAIFDGNEMRGVATTARLTPRTLAELTQQHGTPECGIVAGVRREAVFQSYLNIIKRCVSTTYVADASLKSPLVNLYRTPQTLGYDRFAAAVGAAVLYPRCNVLVVSAGTALTYELVSKGGEYLGGSISLGLRSRYAALHRFTGRLPLCQPVAATPQFGQNTHDAITAGVQNGMIYEIQGAITHFAAARPHLQTVMTGGDADFLAPHFPDVTVAPHLVLVGLNCILEGQVGE